MKGNKDAFNDGQFQDYNENLSACPNCGRTFLADRLVVHLRSCNPGASGGGSKPVNTRLANSSTPPKVQPQAPTPKAHGASPGASPSAKRSPLLNRLPNDSDAEPRPCPSCSSLEYDPDAKFCQECGTSLPVKNKESLVCKKCKTEWENGHFCQSCGGELEAKSQKSESKQMCTGCGIAVKATSKFCEECGTALQGGGGGSSSSGGGGSAQTKRSPLTNRIPSSGGIEVPPSTHEPHAPPRAGSHSEMPEEYADEQDLVPCSKCGRSFASERLAKHENSCIADMKRKKFDSRKNRVSGTEMAQFQGKFDKQHETTTAKSNWQTKSNAFREAMKSAKEVDTAIKEGKALPPPTYTREEDDTRMPCHHCGRKFAPDVAERHIPKCATTVHKPKAPPKKPPSTSHASPGYTFNNTSSSTATVPDDVARMGVSPEKWQSIQAKKEAEWNDAFGEMPTNLEHCPNCNRKFVPKSLEIHLRSCGGRHGTSKKIKR
eukprot:TRINITY_DN2626_c0_g1_i3.p1 TRINITY_DN2626_c0_g1~~TRINITY_DN2626_c0_g1_i3.p1  ORF type:complete len:489 (+),score=106.71 TRINITY_DN2626_c0_g1_i3:128-1594(+)